LSGAKAQAQNTIQLANHRCPTRCQLVDGLRIGSPSGHGPTSGQPLPTSGQPLEDLPAWLFVRLAGLDKVAACRTHSLGARFVAFRLLLSTRRRRLLNKECSLTLQSLSCSGTGALGVARNAQNNGESGTSNVTSTKRSQVYARVSRNRR
jgi:hypothetical protein